jgi:predicted peptidase
LERRADVPAIVVAPQCPAGQWWRPVDVKTLLDHVVRTYPIDQDRIYLTGLSMGGTGTWLTAAEYPETFAAIAPICGRTLRLRAPPLADMPIWAFHGDADRVVPVTYSTDHVKNIAAAGNTRVKLTVFPDAGHNVWDRVYNDPAFFEWLLAQRR